MPGEIAEMMLNVTMCAQCGEWMHDGEDGDGSPEYCESCRDADEEDAIGSVNGPRLPKRPVKKKNPRDTSCPICERMVRGEEGLINHVRNSHKTSRLADKMEIVAREISEIFNSGGNVHLIDKSVHKIVDIINPLLKILGRKPNDLLPF